MLFLRFFGEEIGWVRYFMFLTGVCPILAFFLRIDLLCDVFFKWFYCMIYSIGVIFNYRRNWNDLMPWWLRWPSTKVSVERGQNDNVRQEYQRILSDSTEAVEVSYSECEPADSALEERKG
jgi:hypothetical protein